MRYLFSILLFCVFALRPFYNLGFTAYYKLNINEIVEKYCVNKDKPVLRCNGKCFLTKKLQQDVDIGKGKDGFSRSRISEAFFPLYYQEIESSCHQDIFFSLLLKNNYPPIKNYNGLFEYQIDRPPIS